MFYNYTFSAIYKYEVGDSCFNELIDLFPNGAWGANNDGFSISFSDDIEKAKQLVDILASYNIYPIVRFYKSDIYYSLRIDKMYELEEVISSDLFCWHPKLNHGYCYRIPPGMKLEIEAKDILVNEPIAADYSGRYIIVNNQLKTDMINAGLLHLTFEEVKLIGRRKKVLENETYWRIYSDFKMPPLSPSIMILDDDGNRLPYGSEEGTPRLGTEILELCTIPQYSYRESDLAKNGPFDLAIMHEHFGYTDIDDRTMIASRRFYEFCEERKLKIDWTPVRIEHGV